MPLGEGRGARGEGGGGVRGSPVCGLDRYVPPSRVWFLSTPSLNRVSFLPLLVLHSRCDPKMYWTILVFPGSCPTLPPSRNEVDRVR